MLRNARHLATLGAAALFVGAACSSHHSTLRKDSSGSEVIYQISQAEALQLAHHALAEKFPGRKITEIKGPPAGYSTSYRMALDTYSQQVIAVPGIGLDSSGNERRGYYFEVSGSGTAVVSGRAKNAELFDRVRELAEQSGRPARVTNLRTDYRQGDKSDSPIIPAPEIRATATTRLRELEQLRREGLISESEYQVKRAKILEGL
jgi:hypothetical protein